MSKYTRKLKKKVGKWENKFKEKEGMGPKEGVFINRAITGKSTLAVNQISFNFKSNVLLLN